MKLSQGVELPIIFHCRVAHNDLLQLLKEADLPFKGGVIHCFMGDFKQAQKFLEPGVYLTFNGLIFKNVPALPDRPC